MVNYREVMDALSAPFEQREVKFKPAVVSGNRALAMPYVDARVIQDRLDEAVGVINWKDEYTVLPDGSVKCSLSLRLGDEWITKEDVGSQSQQPDEGDRLKAAFSDALKRTAVKFGIGRYLYRVPPIWWDYDPQKKQFKSPPRLSSNGAAPAKPATPKPAPAAATIPPSGLDLLQRLRAFDHRLMQAGVCLLGDCVKFVKEAGIKEGWPAEMEKWQGEQLRMAMECALRFESERRAKKAG